MDNLSCLDTKMISCFHCLIIIFCVRFDASNGYENLALNKSTWQPSTYRTTFWTTFASNAVDGNRNQFALDGSCAMQKKSYTAVWRVDLGKVQDIDHIDIYFRHDSALYWNTQYKKRIAGFHIYVSNTTKKEDGVSCFKETGSLQPNMTIKCIQRGKYVIYYNKQNTFLYNELCEVEVYDCPDPGFFGETCSDLCPNNCKNKYCDNENGNCLSCNDGFQGIICDQQCDSHFYGPHCHLHCGNCLNNSPCHHVNGTCSNGCAAGWKEDQCFDECEHLFYGLRCETPCGNCFNNTQCHHINGSCTNGCGPGYQNHDCKTKCDDFKYGPQCSMICGKCLNKTKCHHINGTCPDGCQPGWQNHNCKSICPLGKYGSGCTRLCSDTCYRNSSHFCDHVTGICTIGCKHGWEGDTCNIPCQGLFYGEQCRNECGNCLQKQKCDHVDGTCPDRCDPGWEDSKCKTECPKGKFGSECKQTCGDNCNSNSTHSCDHVTGNCTIGCIVGWEGHYCNIACQGLFYGEKCGNKCGKCLQDQKCDHVDGTCPGRCDPGWQDSKCKTECPKGKFGSECEQTCGDNCKSNSTHSCDHVTGKCTIGCVPGWAGDYCTIDCSNRMYGQDCKEECGNCLNFTQCHHIDGTCTRGCDKGYSGEICKDACRETYWGENCNFTCSTKCINRTCNALTGTCYEEVKADRVYEEDPTEIGSLVGGIIGGLLFVSILALVGVLLFRRYDGNKTTEEETETSKRAFSKKSDGFTNPYENFEKNGDTETHKRPNVELAIDTQEEMEDNIYANNSVEDERLTDIGIHQLESVIERKRWHHDKEFEEEYKSFALGEMFPCLVGKMEQNLKKNRFKTTFPYDHSRVILQAEGADTTDYINANYIDGIDKEKCYIASQGPKQGTVVDFWRMIWQENVKQIVMLTNLKEGIKEKCVQYWPDATTRPLVAGSLSILKTAEKEYSFFIVRKLIIKHTEMNKERTLTQFHYTAWPDHGIPDTLCLVIFHSYAMKERAKTLTSPIVVHCSAGIGRTGTYIALDALYKCGLETGKVNIAEYVKTMRKNRMNMVQTQEQYITIFLTLHEAFKAPVETIPVVDFSTHFEKLTKDTPVNQNVLRREVQTLLKIQPKYGDSDFKMARQNSGLNEVRSSLPLDKYCLYLMTSVSNRGSFINAITVPSFTKPRYFIITPYPTHDSTIDFIRLLFDHHSKTVVAMDPIKEIVASELWHPAQSTSSTVEPFVVTCKSVSRQSAIQTSDIDLVNTKENSVPVKVSFVAPLSNINVGKGCETDLLRTLVDVVLHSDAEQPVTVMSRNAADKCGLFCAVFNVMQQLQLDEEVDVFTAVRQLQVRRPELCSSMNEYLTCYQAINDHLQQTTDHIYSN